MPSFRRRQFLGVALGTAIGTAGCLGNGDDTQNGEEFDCPDEYEWCAQTTWPARHLGSAQGTILAAGSDDGTTVAGHDPASGRQEWSAEFSTTEIEAFVVAGQVYFSGRAADGERFVSAVDFTGTERWEEQFEALCALAATDSRVYIATDGTIEILDAETGASQTHHEFQTATLDDPELLVRGETLYVADDFLSVLDRDTGNRRWSYDNQRVEQLHRWSSSGVAYLKTAAGVAVVSESGVETEITGEGLSFVGRDGTGLTLLLRDEDSRQLHGYGMDGERIWSSEPFESDSFGAVFRDRCYVLDGQVLYGVDDSDGTIEWELFVGEDPSVLTGVEPGIVVETSEQVRLITPDGETAWSTDIPGSLAAVTRFGNLLCLGTTDGVFAVEVD